MLAQTFSWRVDGFVVGAAHQARVREPRDCKAKVAGAATVRTGNGVAGGGTLLQLWPPYCFIEEQLVAVGARQGLPKVLNPEHTFDVGIKPNLDQISIANSLEHPSPAGMTPSVMKDRHRDKSLDRIQPSGRENRCPV